MSRNNDKKNLSTHFMAGGGAGLTEALCCHPLDTIKVRMQLSKKAKRPGFFEVAINIMRKEKPLALYKGLGAVVTGIVPKMAIRFSSFELYKSWMANKTTGKVSTTATFFAGLGAGTTEAILVVTPMDVIKIRLQAQRHSMADPLDIPKYRNAAHAAYTIVREEGVRALYKGVLLTALRQATNQAVNFTVYQEMKQQMKKFQGTKDGQELPTYQHLLMGGISGAMGPIANAPIDTIKTRIQRSASTERGWSKVVSVTTNLVKNEGFLALYKGLLPRLMRVGVGQAVTFAAYERIKIYMEILSQKGWFVKITE
ncbi:mitochondrial carrier domain-containing protein [Gigaspora rosea]|uniref:Mitochondrial carrier domain-containing protein n=1 Tax=Gigaspora rosea TaxID=44941 RepID=A0A397TTK0_9GLOM|nr:mitochondrial carrier domain-containing protein [Gigaspora rosea]CAG8535825.1 20827_t:CDS:2 [Gigaspora rosea]